MKKIFLFCAAIVVFNYANAQLIKRLADRAKDKIEQKINQKVDKKIDDEVDGLSGKKTTSEDGKILAKTGNETGTNGEVGLKTYSKYDFVAGEKILFAEDYSQDVVGEFPLKWNTNGSGEVVTYPGIPGKWLKLQESTKYETPIKNKLPENYTVEFDVLFEYKDDQFVPNVNTRLLSEVLPGHALGGKIEFTLGPNNGTSEQRDGLYYSSYTKGGDQQINAVKKLINTWNDVNHKKVPVHIAMWIQKQRFRAWVNQEKVYDLPQGVGAGVIPNMLQFEVASYGGPAENFSYSISNIRIGEAAPDTRSKLLTEGKWSTTGILFDVNSDKIKPSSYGTLKEIAGTLTENPEVKVKIIGHTDSDGDATKNLDLSKRRAAAVKTALSTEFNINDSRIQTDGAGSSKPVADNKTAEGKAQNRRVEFVKL